MYINVYNNLLRCDGPVVSVLHSGLTGLSPGWGVHCVLVFVLLFLNLHCVLRQDPVLLQCHSPPRSISG